MNDVLTTSTLGSLWVCLVVASASSSIAISITQTELFAPWRAWTDKVHYRLGYLFQCFYCLSHWVVFLGIAIYRPVVVRSGYLAVDWIVSAFLTVTLTTFTSGLMFKVFLMAMSKKVEEKRVKELFATK